MIMEDEKITSQVDKEEVVEDTHAPVAMTDVGDNYQALRAEAEEGDFSDLERAKVLQIGTSEKGLPVVIFVPRLGFSDEKKDSVSQLRRMLLLFIKKAHDIVSNPYMFVYDHMSLSIFSQHPLVFRTYNMLPRAYKKNIKKLYVVHPTFLIKLFFEQGVKRLVSQKFYSKLHFVDSVMDLQTLIKPLGGSLPTAYLKRGDEKVAPVTKPAFDPTCMPPLEASFNPELNTTDLIHQCVAFLRKENRLKTVGLFRLAGDQAVLDLAQVRLFGRLERPSTVIIGSDAYVEACQLISDSKEALTPSFSTLVVTDVHTVTSIIGMALRSLPVSLFIPEYHESLLQLTRKLENDKNMDEWHLSVEPILNSMPECHSKTLQHLLR